MSTTQTPPATELSLEEALKANVERSKAGKSQTIAMTIINVTNWRDTKDGRKVKMVITKDHGNFFPLATAISNLPMSFGQPIEAKATITPNGQYTNMNRLEFAGLTSELSLAIGLIPSGAALFSSAKDLKLAI